jgi:hypothetical protein
VSDSQFVSLTMPSAVLEHFGEAVPEAECPTEFT